ncbi:unnamed protein product [Polarella glacialis]|uniref:Protein kinase domain-containing protein n=1 Tax=Polarella glacialis TaxID=89957 RepID=A0A813JED2_POLGL|nr:unnamed protein product [Polarella glacialis]
MDREDAGPCQRPKVWLHSSHQQAPEPGVARKLQCPLPDGVSDPQSCELAIRTLLERAATGFELSVAPSDLDSGRVAKSLEMPDLSIIPRTEHFEVTLGTSDLLICSTLESDSCLPLSILRVQLLFSDVMWASVPVAGESEHAGSSINNAVSLHYIVAVVPHEDEHSCGLAAEGEGNTEPVSAAHGLPFQEAWLLCVGACSQSDFQDFLRELGCRGAIRWDLKKCCRLVRELNSGAFSTVYLGKSFQHLEGRSMISPVNDSADAQAATQVAVKRLNVHARMTQTVVKSEIDFLVQCRGHPNITQLYGVFCSCLDSGRECIEASEQSDPASSSQLCWSIVMDFFPTGDLHDFLARRGPLDQAEGLEIFCGVMSALAHLHVRRVAHRDVKAENILLSDQGQAILADFGSAAHIDDNLAMKETNGSPGYAAPEVVDGRPYGVMADVFSAGVVLYFALSNGLPFPGDVSARIRRTSRCKVKFGLSKFGHLSGDVMALLRSLLEKNPQLRPTSGCCFEVSWLCLPAEVQCRSRATLVAYTTLFPNRAQRLQQQDENPQEQHQVNRITSIDSLSSQDMDITMLSPSSSSASTSSSSVPVSPVSSGPQNEDVFNPQSCSGQNCFVSRRLDTDEESPMNYRAMIRKVLHERCEANLQVQGDTDNAGLVRVPPAAAARITRKGLEVDGVNSRLFELLWKKDLLSDSSISLRIPDTVVFKYSAPSLWYFTSVDGTIKRKTKAKVNEQHIVEEFLKRPSLSGIVAYYVTTTEETVEQSRKLSRELRDDGDLEAELAGTRTTIQYLNEEGLKNFLFNRQQAR